MFDFFFVFKKIIKGYIVFIIDEGLFLELYLVILLECYCQNMVKLKVIC